MKIRKLKATAIALLLIACMQSAAQANPLEEIYSGVIEKLKDFLITIEQTIFRDASGAIYEEIDSLLTTVLDGMFGSLEESVESVTDGENVDKVMDEIQSDENGSVGDMGVLDPNKTVRIILSNSKIPEDNEYNQNSEITKRNIETEFRTTYTDNMAQSVLGEEGQAITAQRAEFIREVAARDAGFADLSSSIDLAPMYSSMETEAAKIQSDYIAGIESVDNTQDIVRRQTQIFGVMADMSLEGTKVDIANTEVLKMMSSQLHNITLMEQQQAETQFDLKHQLATQNHALSDIQGVLSREETAERSDRHSAASEFFEVGAFGVDLWGAEQEWCFPTTPSPQGRKTCIENEKTLDHY